MEAAVSQRLGEEVGEGMSRASASRPPPQPPPPASGSGGRLAVLASHLSQSSRTAGEKEAALAAGPSDGPTIFDKILRKEIPSQVVYEDEKVCFCQPYTIVLFSKTGKSKFHKATTYFFGVKIVIRKPQPSVPTSQNYNFGTVTIENLQHCHSSCYRTSGVILLATPHLLLSTQ
ncbi:hypothetical protein DAI22_01g374100 [Oryza sativa Japonica Group]|nr:hypothetical protein DAI22_01g374100 [Oryza sativa Japonica Group]